MKYVSNKGNLNFIIEEDSPDVGVYFYVYEKEKSIADYLQDDVNSCKKQAYDMYGVLYDSWVIVDDTYILPKS
ncbi:MAG: hypothetical protein K5867_02975 [Bacteroidales bacterium]|nr:hypothetical protein [Bacteroidales bacterium]